MSEKGMSCNIKWYNKNGSNMRGVVLAEHKRVAGDNATAAALSSALKKKSKLPSLSIKEIKG